MNYYQIFLDMGISGAMARCGVSAKNESDYQRWLREMDRFDAAAEELGPKDRSRYYFAKGLLLLQCVPSKIQTLPEAFYKAAENGFPSTYIAGHLTVSDAGASTYRTDAIADVLIKLAESYRKGGVHDEAYKFYLLSLKAGRLQPETFLKMAECGRSAGSDRLSLATGLMFLDVFSAYDGAAKGDPAPIAAFALTADVAATEVVSLAAARPWNDTRVFPADSAIASRSDGSGALRAFNTFDAKYAQPISKTMGASEDLFKIAVSARYWNDTLIVKRTVARVGGPIDGLDGAIAELARKVREDPVLGSDAELAKWEARRWKAAGKLSEFSTTYPDRYKLAAIE
jgi:hypothetical protein